MNICVRPDQLLAVAGRILRDWGDYGYVIEGIESPTFTVSVFRIVASDGSRFTIAADKWGNCRDWESTDGEAERVAAMHQAATTR